jgi:hypothetical protein
MQKLRGELHTQTESKTRPILSRTSYGAVSSTLRLENNPDEIRPPVEVFTTLGESGSVSVRIEINGHVAYNEYWPHSELIARLEARA